VRPPEPIHKSTDPTPASFHRDLQVLDGRTIVNTPITMGTFKSTALAEFWKNQLKRPCGPSTTKRNARVPPPLENLRPRRREPPVAGIGTGT